MTGGWRYRIASVLGVVSLSVLAVRIANVPTLQAGFALVPVIGHLPFEPAYGTEFAFEAATKALVMLAALVPLYKPRPRRILDADADLVEFVEDRPGHDQRYALDSSKLEALGWQPSWSFEEGLQQAVEYYLD